MSVYAYSNIFTDILIRYGYDMLKTGSGKIEVAKTDFINFDEMTNRASTKANSYAITTKIGNKKFNITAFINTSYGGTQKIFSTVSNVVNILGVHEYKGHGIYKIGSKNKDHIRHACGSLFISPNTLSYSTLLKTTNSKRYKF